MLLAVIFFPVLAGLAVRLLSHRGAGEKAVKTAALVGTVITSLAVLAVLLAPRALTGTVFTPVRFNEALCFSFAADGASLFFAGLVAVLWPFALCYAFLYMKEDEAKFVYFSYYVMTYGAVLGIAFAANALTMYVFYEALTFLTLPLIIHTQTKESRKAGRVYLYYSLSGSSLALAGIVIVTVLTGRNDFLAGGILQSSSGMTQFAYGLTFFGFGVKAAVFPLCRWLPTASAAPTPTTALLHAVAVVKSGAFAILRMTYYCFSPADLNGSAVQMAALAAIAVTIVYGSGMALREMHIKRRFAYSTVANLSYILFGLLLCTESGLSSSLLHFAVHSVTKIGIFFLAGAVIETTGAHYIYELNGMGVKMPVTTVMYALLGFSLVGIPPFGGFVSKYYLVAAGWEAGSAAAYIGAGAVICSAILTAAYVFTVLFRLCFREPLPSSRTVYENAGELSRGYLWIIGVFAFLALAAGIFAEPICQLICAWMGGSI